MSMPWRGSAVAGAGGGMEKRDADGVWMRDAGKKGAGAVVPPFRTA